VIFTFQFALSVMDSSFFQNFIEKRAKLVIEKDIRDPSLQQHILPYIMNVYEKTFVYSSLYLLKGCKDMRFLLMFTHQEAVKNDLIPIHAYMIQNDFSTDISEGFAFKTACFSMINSKISKHISNTDWNTIIIAGYTELNDTPYYSWDFFCRQDIFDTNNNLKSIIIDDISGMIDNMSLKILDTFCKILL